jgi:hypothetical protein
MLKRKMEVGMNRGEREREREKRKRFYIEICGPFLKQYVTLGKKKHLKFSNFENLMLANLIF